VARADLIREYNQLSQRHAGAPSLPLRALSRGGNSLITSAKEKQSWER
jgi:hypothetical protein